MLPHTYYPICQTPYNKSKGRYLIARDNMPKNVAVLLYVFAALSLVSKLGGGIDQIAYAQLTPYSPPIENQNQNANNAIQPSNDLPLNNNAIQPSNGRSSTSSNCMVT